MLHGNGQQDRLVVVLKVSVGYSCCRRLHREGRRENREDGRGKRKDGGRGKGEGREREGWNRICEVRKVEKNRKKGVG